MELFDKEFVYFMWDDKLEGQKGFVANYINDLKLAVNQGYWTKYGTLHKGSDAYPFRTIVDERWCLCYCDPNYEIKKAFNEGKKVQVCDPIADVWYDCIESNEPKFLEKVEYRVKPEDKKHYRPYVNSSEMIVDFIARFKVNCPSYCEPLIWVKNKQTDARFLITGIVSNPYDGEYVEVHDSLHYVGDLFDNYTYLDGSPVGMEVKE